MTDFVARTGIRIVGPNCYGNASSVYQFAGMPNTAIMMQRVGKLSLAFQSGGQSFENFDPPRIISGLIQRLSHCGKSIRRVNRGSASDHEIENIRQPGFFGERKGAPGIQRRQWLGCIPNH